MIILAVDTAGPMCAACLYDGELGQATASVSKNIGRGHAEHLPSVVSDVLDQAGLSFEQITHIAATTGPGSFAGIRVGISFCRALALALEIPSTGVSSLQAMAYGVSSETGKNTLALLDARRGEVYLSAIDPSGAILIEPKAATYRQAQPIVASGKYVICGNGILPVKEVIEGGLSVLDVAHENAFPNIQTVAKLAVNQLKCDQVLALRPQYLRQADAKPNENFALSCA